MAKHVGGLALAIAILALAQRLAGYENRRLAIWLAVLGVLLLILCSGLIVNDTIAWWRKRRQETDQATEETPLPASRPRLAPVRYDKLSLTSLQHGLFIGNEGEPAYDVSVEPLKLGRRTVEFAKIDRLDKGTPVFSGVDISDYGAIQKRNLIWALQEWQAAVQQRHIVIPFNIIYRDFDGVWYRSVCELGFSLFRQEEVTVRFVRQERR